MRPPQRHPRPPETVRVDFEGEPTRGAAELAAALELELGARWPSPEWRWAGLGRDTRGWYVLAAPDLDADELAIVAEVLGV